MGMDVGARKIEIVNGKKSFTFVNDQEVEDFRAIQSVREVLSECEIDFSKIESFIVLDHQKICEVLKTLKMMFEQEKDKDRKEVIRHLGMFFGHCYQKYYYVTIG